MSLTKYSLDNPRVIHFFLIVLLIAGINAFFELGKSEDAKFIIKQVMLKCEYPGASQWEVEELVTEVIESQVQQISNIKHVKSESMPGVAYIDVEFMPISPDLIPQKFDELRRKVREAEQMLPAGASSVAVNDMFGDVLGMYYGIYADESIDDNVLKAYAKYIKRELTVVDGVSKINLYGIQKPVINVEISQERLANLGVDPETVFQTIRLNNKLNEAGKLAVGRTQFRVDATNGFSSLEDVGEVIIKSNSGKTFRLKDIAVITQDFQDPADYKMRVNGKRGIGLAIANEDGKNVVATGEFVKERLAELMKVVPIGITVTPLYMENDVAQEANDSFISNLVISVVIVVLILIFAMGLKPSLLIGTSLIFSIIITLVLIKPLGITLNRTTLAAIIIAMGMLVDNAIVVADNALNAMKRGVSKRKAFIDGATIPQWGLFGATFIAIASFLPLQLAKDDTAEVIQPLVIVLGISLFLSWVFAMVQTPVYGMFMIKEPEGEGSDPFDTPFFRSYKKFMTMVIEHKWKTLGVTIAIFVGFTMWGESIPQTFFPFVEKPLFKAQYWLPNGTKMDEVEKDVKVIENWLLEQPGVKNVSVTFGSVPMRYYLSAVSLDLYPNLAHFLIEYEDAGMTVPLSNSLDSLVTVDFPEAMLIVERFKAAPTPKAELEATFMGPDPEVLRRLAEQAKDSMRTVDIVHKVRDNWREKTPVLRPEYSQNKGREYGVSKQAIANSMSMLRGGINVGEYRERDEVMPILVKEASRKNFDNSNLASLPVFSDQGTAVPLGQVVNGLDVDWENSRIYRYNRQRAISAQCEPINGVESPQAEAAVIPKVESIPLPEGYTLWWDGLYIYQQVSNEAIAEPLPLTLVVMFSILLLLFRRFQEPVMIFVLLPFIWIGVVLGMKVMGQPFGFMAILGLLGLIGMVIKNAIVLLEQVQLEIDGGMSQYDALISAAQSRLVPVSMAAGTTILGMAPIATDAMFGGMASAIMGGLFGATLLTLIVLPVFYAFFFNVKKPD